MSKKNKRLTLYFIIAFVPAWIFQIIGSLCKRASVGGEETSALIFTLSLTVSMFMPLLATVISAKVTGENVGLKIKPNLKGNVRLYLAGMIFPSVFSTVGSVLYFLICKKNFDPEFTSLNLAIQETASNPNMKVLSPVVIFLMIIASSIFAAPVINAVPSLGEEGGWRGYMTPALCEKFGNVKGKIISGVIWGVWHWPVIALAGYNFGTGYPLYPIPGLLAMCFACTALGTLLSFLYEKTDSIWAPSIAHGAVNAFLNFSTLFLAPGVNDMVLGPTLGFISVLPFALLSVVILVKSK